MQVRFFGRLADHAGSQLAVALPTGGCTLCALQALIAEQDPALGAALERPGVRACVGRDFAAREQWLGDDDAVEYWPPVSGG